MPYRPDIDGLRALAVLAVIGYHFAPQYIKGGFIGVDVFFVISGFLITSIIVREIEAGTFTFSWFYARRIRRIYPALTIVLLTVLAIGPLLFFPDAFKRLGWQTIAGALFSSNFLLWREAGYFDTSSQLKPLLHLWSLGIEEQFYLLWPLTMVAIWKLPKWRTWLIIGIALVSFGLNVYFIKSNPSQSFYAPWTRYWELMVGALLAIMLQPGRSFSLAISKNLAFLFSGNSSFRSNRNSLIGLGLIALSVVYLSNELPYPGWYALAPTVGAALVITAGPMAFLNRYILSNRVAVFVGRISYPLYLWHWPLLAYIKIFAGDDFNLLRTLKLPTVVTAFVLAALTYLFWETPLRKITRVKIIFSAFAVALAITVGAGGLAILFSDKPVGPMTDFQRKIVKDYVDEKAVSQKVYKEGDCLLGEETGQKFSSSCRATESPEVFLWGDSHAADLNFGVRELFSAPDKYVSQYTVSSCPPLLKYDTDWVGCRRLNDQIFSEIQIQKPKVVILSARWWCYNTQDFVPALMSTIEQIKTVTNNVILIGPQPVLKKDPLAYFFQPFLLSFRAQYSYYPVGDIAFVRGDIVDYLRAEDSTLNEIAVKEGIEYVSFVTQVCYNDSCSEVVYRREQPRILNWDQTHLTREGSSLYVGSFLFPILEKAYANGHYQNINPPNEFETLLSL